MNHTPDLPFEVEHPALPSPFPPALVRASAGSGKTFDLVHRYIGLLAAGADPTKILATTFTRKAAGEILARVLLRLARCVTDRAILAEVNEEIPPEFALTAKRAEQLLGHLCLELPRLQVETLDAFFHRIASGHAFELELPPDWGIGDNATLAKIRRRAIHDLLEGNPRAAAEMMRRLHRGEIRRSVAEQLDSLVVDLHHRWLESPESAWDTIEIPPAPEATEIDAAHAAIAALPIPRTKKDTEVKSWKSRRDEILRALEENQLEGVWKNGLVKKILDGEPTYARKPIEVDWERALAAPLADARHRELERLVTQNRASRDLIGRYDEFERLRRDAMGIYDFGTVTRRLGENSITTEILRVYERIDARIDHVLLDEFQDTSLIQYVVLLPILKEITSSLGGDRTFFCVGDVKQAIYGWRGGRRALFDAVEHLLPAGSARTKAKSWRSSPIILESVNQVFETLERAFHEEDDAETAARWREAFPHHVAAKEELPGFVSLEIATANEAEEDLLPRELPYARTIDTIREIRDRDPRVSIGVLLRKNDRVGALIDLLREEGIDASQEGGNPLSDSAAVNRILAALHFADHPADRAAHFAVSASPLGTQLGLGAMRESTTNAAAARRLRTTLLEEGYGRTILRLAEAMAPICDERDRVRLDQLVELAHRFGDETGLRPSNFVDRVRQTRVESPTGSRVQVMTIHRSKGLEFDVVILPQLTDSWFNPSPTLLAAASNPLQPADRLTRYANQDLRRLCQEELEPIYRSHRAELVTESISLLYVALTRARHALHLWLPPGRLGEGASFARIARVQLGGKNQTLDGSEETVLYRHGDPNWIERWQGSRPLLAELPPLTGVPESAPTPEPPLRETVTPRRPPSPSALAGTKKGEARARRRAQRIGTTVHALLEAIEWHQPSEGESSAITAVAHAAARATLPIELTPFIAEAAEQVESAFQNPAARELYSLEATRVRLASLTGEAPSQIECARELPYGLSSEREGAASQTGIIDRIHWAVASDSVVGAEIIDAKTTPLEGDPLAEHLRTEYTAQLTAYRDAVAALFSIPNERITTKILAIPSGEVIEINQE